MSAEPSGPSLGEIFDRETTSDDVLTAVERLELRLQHDLGQIKTLLVVILLGVGFLLLRSF